MLIKQKYEISPRRENLKFCSKKKLMYSKIYIFALGILVLTSSKMGVRDTNAEFALFERT